QETYGEDSFLLGEMGAALVRGTGRHVLSCVKHFAVNSMENSRLWVDVKVDERDLRDIYLPHFRRCLDEGAESVMSAYNGVNGDRCGHSRWLLTDVLKDEWGFDGFVMSDFTFGISSATRAVNAGMDLEMPYRALFAGLRRLVRTGRVPGSRVRDAAARMVRAQLRAQRKGEPDRYQSAVVAGPEHRALAREAAARSVVLLRNEPVQRGDQVAPVLPFDPNVVRSIAVVGALASVANRGDLGSSQVHPPEVATVLDGLLAAGEGAGIAVRYTDGSDLADTASVVESCDVAVVVVGHTFRDEGEWIIRAGGDRSSLELRTEDVSLIGSVARRNPRTVVLLMGGSAIVTDRWHHLIPALAMVWYPGMEGGHGIADVLFGAVPPQGRLPLTWPGSSTALPPFDRFCRRTTYGPLHGYRMMEATRQRPSFPFGYGLGYGPEVWGTPSIVSVEANATGSDRSVTVAVDVRAAGDRDVVAVVQVYVPEVLGSHPEPLRTLRGVGRATVRAGASETVAVTCSVPDGVDEVFVGRSSAADDLVSVPLG
ncbi:MAG: glycoside hydrolase family 3 protein, partial [Actinomycetes bacterium]